MEWASSPINIAKDEITTHGVTVKKIGEEYSPVLPIGNVLDQSNLVFSGPVTANVLKADATDFTKARQAVSLTASGATAMS